MRPGTQPDIGLAPVQFVLSVLSSLAWAGLCFLAAVLTPMKVAHAQAVDGSAGALQAQVEGLLKQQTLPQNTQPGGTDATSQKKQPWRVEVVLGQLDPRLKLAPCDKVRAYMPEGVQMWGKTRVGLRCEQGPVRWNVFWPVTVKVWGQALVAATPLRPGTPIAASDLRVAEVDLAERSAAAIVRAADVVGRSVVRALEPGQALHQDDVKARRWFAAGDPVRLTVRGAGFQIAADGTALTPGDEGQCARVRTDNGRVVCGQPVGDRQVEVSL
jgi:flagella basal body P-ring formation protein FlgA